MKHILECATFFWPKILPESFREQIIVCSCDLIFSQIQECFTEGSLARRISLLLENLSQIERPLWGIWRSRPIIYIVGEKMKVHLTYMIRKKAVVTQLKSTNNQMKQACSDPETHT
jgi:hypothetical protein